MENRVTFRNPWLPYVLVLPQVLVTLVFFVWPALQALRQSALLEDAFGGRTKFVGFDNFTRLLGDAHYYETIQFTFVYSLAVAVLAMVPALLFAVMADRVVRGATGYKTLLIWPYAVAPAVAGVLWFFLFDPTVGVIAYVLKSLGYGWNHKLVGNDAIALVVIAAAWKQISYNFIFFLAGLQSIPRSLIEAAAIDGAGPAKRFRTIVFPLLSPTTFFLVVVNVVYAFFDTFGVIHATTYGGPHRATENLVFKVFNDGFIGTDLGSSSAQSVILMLIVIGLSVIQFRYVERRVHY